MAEQAERFAAFLHRRVAMTDEDAARRTALAAAELEVADVLRRNAAKLREAGWQFPLEHLPALPREGTN
jgi:hypothetical protein